MRVLVADSRTDVRWALRTAASAMQGLSVVGEAAEANDLLAQVRAYHPDVILMEWGLPGPPSASLLADLRAANGGVEVIALGVWPEAKEAALAAGASAFVVKTDPPERILSAMRALERNLTIGDLVAEG